MKESIGLKLQYGIRKVQGISLRSSVTRELRTNFSVKGLTKDYLHRTNSSDMKWITREGVKVDRVACPWLIHKFVDSNAEFFFAPKDQVLKSAKELGAIPFDTPGAELFHVKEGSVEYVTFDAIIKKYKLDDPALKELAKIVRGADTKTTNKPPESAGLEAAALGFRSTTPDDHENLKLQFPLYDALYAFCKQRISGQDQP